MPSLPLFYHDAALKQGDTVQLAEDTARHVVQVLRMQPGEPLQLTDGKGHLAEVVIKTADKKKASVQVVSVASHTPAQHKLHLAIAFTKNTSRNEWLLEKATELGISTIIPLTATRTERERIRHDRWNNILISAILQSQQYHLPKLTEATTLKELTARYAEVPQKLIAHCIADKPRQVLHQMLKPALETIILIGPEGDFTADEVTLCEAQGYQAVSLGGQRMRTETAAMSVCAYFNVINHEKV